MSSAPVAHDSSRRILDLARHDRSAAGAALDGLSLEAQVALICESPVAHRSELLGLAASPEALIPCIPEAELCFTIKALGLADADWILAHATPDQLVAGIDLDAWDGHEIELAKLGEWLDALARTPRASLVRGVQSLDPELLARLLRSRIEVVMKPAGDDDWTQPEGTQTLEGQFFYKAIADGDDLASLTTTLHAFFEEDYWSYFRMMQSVIWELDSDLEEYALRWRTGRLQDLGFPPRDEALSIYRYLDEEQRVVLAKEETALDVSAWQLPVWLPKLPAAVERNSRLFAAIAALDPNERQGSFYAFIAVANKVAVADRMELSDAESTPRAIEKAALLIGKGLEHLASHHGIDDASLLRRAPMERLFSVGANLDPESARP